MNFIAHRRNTIEDLINAKADRSKLISGVMVSS